jgi:hypothetical protein
VFAFRVDLRLPLGVELPDYACTNEVITRFLESFKAKVEHDRQRARTRYRYAHDSRARYVWTREVSRGERSHYHLLILLNGDAYFTVGRKTSTEQNISHRLQEAWATALELSVEEVSGLVEIPRAAGYLVTRARRAEIKRQTERYVEAIAASSEPAYHVSHDHAGDPLHHPTPLAISVVQLKRMHDFILGLEGDPDGEALRAFEHVCRRAGLEFSPLVGMVCLNESEDGHLSPEEVLNLRLPKAQRTGQPYRAL